LAEGLGKVMANPDPLGRRPSDERALRLELPWAGLAPKRGALPHVAGSAPT